MATSERRQWNSDLEVTKRRGTSLEIKLTRLFGHNFRDLQHNLKIVALFRVVDAHSLGESERSVMIMCALLFTVKCMVIFKSEALPKLEKRHCLNNFLFQDFRLNCDGAAALPPVLNMPQKATWPV